MNTKISIIACLARDGAIGYNNQLLYHITEDMQRFKQLTMGHTVIMGRNTYLSLPKGALPHRTNIIVSSTLSNDLVDGSIVCKSLADAINLCHNLNKEEAFIIGGSRLYREAFPWAKALYLTIVDDTPQRADAYFPYDLQQIEKLHEKDWEVENKQNMHSGNLTYQFVTLRRKERKTN